MSNVYTKDKIISKCGYFNKKLELTYGLHFIYDSSGKPVEIEEYYQGKKIGSCKMQ
jgi:antitoxin component YwqK of YwqJK toxin-antitoxin module